MLNLNLFFDKGCYVVVFIVDDEGLLCGHCNSGRAIISVDVACRRESRGKMRPQDEDLLTSQRF
jgi:hypothetical protein